LEESYREIERKETARGELLRRVLSVQEEERKRIARELHDETTQSILGLVMRLEAASTGTDELPPRVKNLLAEIKTLGNRTLDSVHRIIYDLRPSVLDDLGLLSALRWLAEHRLSPLEVKTRVEVTGEEKKLPPHIEIALFRVVQEALTNIARHAEAHNVVVSVEFKESVILIEVEDDGKGFDISAIGPASEAKGVGLGLMGMEERVALLGGKFEIEAHPGDGTHLTIEVPLI
ncbi:MAG: sensor histidine kinase, partial [Dehalococcoidales bacterium]|nr:sensor histidine kinase [Dehalococcoidales bacterium]